MHNRKQKLKKILAIVVILCLPLTGCYDATEIDEEAYALVIGVDKGVNNMIRVTFQYATYKDGGGGKGQGGGGGGGDEESGEIDDTIVATVEAPSLLEGIDMLNSAVNREVSLIHAKVLVFSEEYARGGVGMYVEPLVRFRETREFMRIIVCKGTAREFIQGNRNLIGMNSAKSIDLMFEQSKNTGYFPDVIFNDFYIDLLTPYGQATAIYAGVNDFKHLEEGLAEGQPPLNIDSNIEPGNLPRKGGTKDELLGTAVFDGDKMVGHLFQHETRFFLLGIGEFRTGFFTIEDPEMPGYIFITGIQLARKPKIKAHFENGVPVIDLELMLDANIVSLQSRLHYETVKNIRKLELAAEKYFQEGLSKTVEKTQKEFNSDIFHFGKKIAGNFKTIQEFEKYNWVQHYKDAKINVKVDVNIRRTGSIFGASPIRSTIISEEVIEK